MAASTTGADVIRRMIDGKGYHQIWFPSTNGTLTAGTAASGHFSNSLNCNSVGTTHPGTLVGFPLPPTTDAIRSVIIESSYTTQRASWLGYFYRFGTANLTSTVGERFTHDSTFTRIRRTRFGTANSNIPLILYAYVTTAASVTQAAYTVTYADQDGVSTVSPTNNLPAATTAVQGLYNIILNSADSAVLDVTSVACSTATTGGIISLYGFEPLAKIVAPTSSVLSYEDHLYGALNLVDMLPAGVDAGSVTSLLGLASPLSITNSGASISVRGFNNA